ncbi:MAG: YbhB/YbcL family Raf kinase inhibitor-like protein [Gammaproteobacteria bacterium]|nr:YbhB/YbcL family Raf kinase inhibitor-like protein [Gammaproteobacteria bacterium]
MAMKLISTAFIDGGKLPSKYTCDGTSISPPIGWEDTPANTKSFALIYDDPDATTGTWDHWVLYNIPPTTKSLPENASHLPTGTQVGLNSWPNANYGAPCPPYGEHRYIFHLYALDTELNLSGKVTSDKLRQAMQNHILATATLTGLYQRIKF